MPLYSAVIDTPYGTIGPDLIEAPDLTAALARARSLAEDLARDALRHTPDASGWHVRLSDEAGATVGEIPLGGQDAAGGIAGTFDGRWQR